MKNYISYLVVMMLSVFPVIVSAQSPEAQYQIEVIAESVAEDLEEEMDASVIIEDLEFFALHPLNINSATSEQLSRLHLLNDIQIEHLVEYREKYGPVLSIYELKEVQGLDQVVLMKLEPFVIFGPETTVPRTLSGVMKYGRHEILLRTVGTLQKADGYRRRDNGLPPYEGNRFRYYSRYRFLSGDDVSAGLLAEKDPGEAFFTGSNHQGYDFYSAHVGVKINSFIPNVTLGDFIMRSGQGLVVWQGFSMGKSSNVVSISKTNQGIRPHTSSDENQFFRGLVTTLNFQNVRLNIFYSSKYVDGNRAYNDSASVYFTSLQKSGYHRTSSEIEDKNSVRDLNAGTMAQWQKGNLKLGAVLLFRQFNMPFDPAPQLYNLFYFRGRENYATGIDYLYSKGKYHVFGEAAMSKSGGKAGIQGMTAYLHDRLQLSALLRYFEKDYHALWAAPFAESRVAANEKGIYISARILPVRHISFSAYADMYSSDWIRYTAAGPSEGWDIFTQVDFKPPGRMQLYFRYKNEEKEQKMLSDRRYVNTYEQFRKSRLHMTYTLLPSFVLKTRFEHVSYSGNQPEHGFMAFQDVQVVPQRVPVKVSARVAWFKTNGFNSRIYAYENDLLYAYAIPSYFGTGMRYYLNLKYKFNENIEGWLKVGNTMLNNVESTGTGYNEIAGNQKTELKFQIRLKI